MLRKKVHQRGFALLIVLWGLSLIVVLAGVFTLVAHTQTRTVSNILDIARAEAAAEAGVVLMAQLLGQQVQKPTQRLNCTWSGGITLHLVAEDERNKINLNLAGETALPDYLAEVLGGQVDTRSLAQRILDFRDLDTSSRPQGAETQAYERAGFVYGTKDAAFDTIEELDQVLDVSSNTVKQLRPHVTVLSGRGDRAGPQTPIGVGNAFLIQATAVTRGGLSFTRHAHIVMEPAADTMQVVIRSWRRSDRDAAVSLAVSSADLPPASMVDCESVY